jgi:carbon-monoxide dehydrogenase medium subunit
VTDLATPRSLGEALEILAETDARPIGGGLAFMLRRQLGEPLPDRLVAVAGLEELRVIELTSGGRELVVGAAVTLAELARSPLVRTSAGLLAAASGVAANPGIRTTATIGGNLIDRPGASDPAAALLALAARTRWATDPGAGVPFPASQLLDPGRSRRGLLVALVVPIEPSRRWGWERLQTRGAGDRPTASVAVTLRGATRGLPTGRAWVTSVAALPVELPSALAAVVASGTPAKVEAALDRDLEGVTLVDDARSTAAYRRSVLAVLLRRAVRQALDRPASARAT